MEYKDYLDEQIQNYYEHLDQQCDELISDVIEIIVNNRCGFIDNWDDDEVNEVLEELEDNNCEVAKHVWNLFIKYKENKRQ